MQTIDDKKQIVKDFTKKVEQASGIYLADFTGIDVEHITALRNTFREKEIQMQVVKNTLLKRIFSDLKITGLDEYLIGPTSVILAKEDEPSEPAKIIIDFHKKNQDLLSIKSVQIEAQTFDGSKIKDLSKMPNKKELQATIISLAMAPGSNLVGLLKGPSGMLAGQIKSIKDKLEEEGA